MAKKQLTLEEKINNALVPEEQLYKVPDNWCWVRLGSVSDIILGQSPKRDDITEDEGFTPLISGWADLANNSISVKRYAKVVTRLSQAGDVIISTKANIGMPVIADGEYCLGRGVSAIRSGVMDKDYTRLLLLHFEDYLYESASESSSGQVTGKTLQNMPIPFPPLSEQKRIVSAIGTMCSDLDRAEAKVQGVLDGAEQRRKTLIYGGITGKLTSYWRKVKGIGDDSWSLKSLSSKDVYESFLNWFDKLGYVRYDADTKEMIDVQARIPSLSEQQEINSVLRNLLNKEEKITAACEETLDSIGDIRQAILLKAFSGKLGTNDPTEASSLDFLKEKFQEQD